MALAIGLISGTSMDGIDAALVRVESETGDGVSLEAFRSFPYEAQTRVLLRRCQREGRLEALARLDVLLGELFAQAANALLQTAGVDPDEVECVGSHGQTLLHLPEPATDHALPLRASLQIGDGAVIAARTGLVTVSDFRSADLALGGQGAPLVPWLDWHLFRHQSRPRMLTNLGGVANVTWLPAGAKLADVVAFDTGPGNVLIDRVARQRGLPGGIDEDGRRAASGTVDRDVLDALLADPYYDEPPPKSADAERFTAMLGDHPNLATEDLLATLTRLTARTLAEAVDRWVPGSADAEILVAGGGVHNATLMAELGRCLAPRAVEPLAADGALTVDAKEAVAFALIALETLRQRPGNVPSATGAAGPAILGKVSYPPPLQARSASSGDSGAML